MAKTYYTYRIRVTNYEHVQVEKLDAKHQDLEQPDGVFRYREKLEEITPLLQITRANQLNDSSQTRALGETLFDVLFDEALRHDFVDFYHQVVEQEKQLLRVELDIDERGMPEVAALPWEFLCLPQRANLGTIWMGTIPDLVFSRRRSQWMKVQPIQLKTDEKLKIALVVSAPPDLSPVAYEPVQKILEKLAEEQESRVELLPIVNAANPEAIDTILSQEPHIFHFIGHGRLLKEGNQEVGQIALVDPDFDEAMWRDADYFSELFNRHRPGVVMLQACEGGMLSASQAFVGVASNIIEQNIPVVVAMQYQVTNSTACRFARRFYQQLAVDDPVDIAAQNGRRAIALGSTQYCKRDFATPVIFMRVTDGYLFEREGTDIKLETEVCSMNKCVNNSCNALTELMEVPEVHEAVVDFRRDFQAVCEQIDIVGDYKDLHDQLHRLEFECYSVIVKAAKQFPDDATALDNLTEYELTLHEIVTNVREIVERGTLAIKEISLSKNLITALEQSAAELSTAIKNLDSQQLKKAIRLIKQLLAKYPSQINTLLIREVQSLHLSTLAEKMTCVGNNLADSELAPENVNQFKKFIDDLSDLERSFKLLANEHDQWQSIDIDLRLIEGTLKYDIAELKTSWFDSDLKAKAESLCGGSIGEKRAFLFKQESEKLDLAIAAQNPAKVTSAFRRYRRLAGLSFYQVDLNLKKHCGQLRLVGEPLNFVLNMLS